jgi:hypothetical protein
VLLFFSTYSNIFSIIYLLFLIILLCSCRTAMPCHHRRLSKGGRCWRLLPLHPMLYSLLLLPAPPGFFASRVEPYCFLLQRVSITYTRQV